jgi:hypothetical protein
MEVVVMAAAAVAVAADTGPAAMCVLETGLVLAAV